jgi:hypothetical protein
MRDGHPADICVDRLLCQEVLKPPRRDVPDSPANIAKTVAWAIAIWLSRETSGKGEGA